METLTLDLCTLLFPRQERESLLFFLERASTEIICYSYLPRATTKDSLRAAGLLPYIDNIIYGPVPVNLVNRKDATVRSCMPRTKWPTFMQLLS